VYGDAVKSIAAIAWCHLGGLHHRFAENPLHFATFGGLASPPGNMWHAKSRSCRHCGHQLRKLSDIQYPTEIISQSSQAELTANLLQASHQKCPLVHPLLDGPKWMLDRLAAAIEDIGALRQAGLHPIQDRLVLETRDRAELATRA
jgi:hypothetical protein